MRLNPSFRGAALAAVTLAVLGASPAAVSAEPNVQQLDRRLQRLENIVNSGQLAEILQQMNTLSGEIRSLRGDIETQTHRLDELRKRQRNLYADLDRRIRELEVAGRLPADAGAGSGSGSASGNGGTAADSAGTAAGAAGEAAAGATASATSETGGGDTGATDSGTGAARDPEAERKAYDAAFGLLREGRYEDAAGSFRSFLDKFPDGPYADNAQYWLGEARYVTRKFEPALAAFRKVVEQHPGSAKVPDARLKIGYTLYEMGRYDEARKALQTATNKHPDSAVARLAEERLVRMKNEGR